MNKRGRSELSLRPFALPVSLNASIPPRERFEKRDQILLFLLGKAQWMKFLVQVQIGPASAIVEFDDVQQGLRAAIVKIRGSQGDVAERRGAIRADLEEQG